MVRKTCHRHDTFGLLGCHDWRMAWRIDPEGVETRTLARLAPVDDLRVLELGCGDGRLTFRYADAAASVLAVDPTSNGSTLREPLGVRVDT